MSTTFFSVIGFITYKPKNQQTRNWLQKCCNSEQRLNRVRDLQQCRCFHKVQNIVIVK